MKSGFLPQRFAVAAACLFALPLGLSSVGVAADSTMPPLGYVGPVDTIPVIQTIAAAPLVGYTEPVDRSSVSSSSASLPMPIGYVGPVPRPKAEPVSDDIKTAHPGETLITARTMHSDSDNGIMTAIGKVEIVRNGYVLHADKVIYNQNTGVMIADGHVAMLAPNGEVEFADHQEITGDMKQAVATNFGILFPDNSRMAGTTAQRYDERYTVANHAAYTACNVCAQNPDQPPLWQMHADTITHDNVDHTIYYHDATIDVAGVPVAYTPYLSTPDPTVKRQQGFLSPQPGYTPNIGTYIKTPYYVDIAPDKDATITPTFSTTDKLQLASQYRERFAQGTLSVDGSITRADLLDESGVDKGEKWRGDLFGTFLYDINSTWRAGTDVQYASDKSYLPRYDITSLDQMTSRAYVEGFQGRDYMALNSYYFRDLRPGPDAAEPLVLPSATFSALGDPGQTLGGRWSFDGNTLITERNNTDQPLAQQGPDTRRLSMNGGWERQMTSDTGLVTTVSGLMRTDSYWADNVVVPNGVGANYDQALFTREFAQANAVVRYPMGRSGDGYQQLMEPIVAVTAAPNVHTSAKQPIEDSLDVEFDETNLFSPNRFTGSDLIEGGSRVTYGMRNAITMDSGGRLDIFGGESYDFSSNDQFNTLSGLGTRASDYVGRIDFAPSPWFNANYGFRLSQNDFSPQQQDAYVSTGVQVFRPSIRYIQAYETDPTTGLLDQVRQATFGVSSTFAKYWTVLASHTQSFDPQPGARNSGVALMYVDECLAWGVNLARDDTNRADISSGTSVAFHLYLKNLGGIHTDSATGINFPAQFRQTGEEQDQLSSVNRGY